MAYAPFCILCAFVLLSTSLILTISNNANGWKMTIFTLALDSSETNKNKQNNNLSFNFMNASSSNSFLYSNKSNGTGYLNVITTVDNKNIGNKSASDFIITVHANDPYPSSFSGNSSGTIVKLGMGMYSVSESYLPGYFISYSKDCFGGIMSTTHIKNCNIKNTYLLQH